MISRSLRALFLLPLALAACSPGKPGGKAPEGEAGEGPSWAYEKEASGGPVSLVLRLDRLEAGLADTLLLEQELHVAPGFEADFPEFLPEDFEGFSVVDIRAPGGPPGQTPPPRRKRLLLEPERSGEARIAPLAVFFHERGKAEESSFLTDEIAVTIRPIEDAAGLSLRAARGIREAPPEEGGSSIWPKVAGAAALLLAAGAVALWRLRRRRKPTPPIPPDQIAYDQLRRLVAMELIEKGEIERFFVLLSAILREYIENRFLVRAPERTTEEFLEEAARDRALQGHRGRLGQFLSLCDQVKFARYTPEESAIQGAFDVTTRFLEETRVHEPPVL